MTDEHEENRYYFAFVGKKSEMLATDAIIQNLKNNLHICNFCFLF